MKKLMLILMLVVLACTAYGCEKQRPDSPAEGMLWDNHGEMEFYDGSEWVALSETKAEIKTGQVWKRKGSASGSQYEVLDVGDKYVVYRNIAGSVQITSAERIEDFCKEYERNVVICTTNSVLTWTPNGFLVKEVKPYLHKNPDNDHWICSKHGDLQENVFSSVMTVTPDDDGGETTYCQTCVYRLLVDQLNQHITGVKE